MNWPPAFRRAESLCATALLGLAAFFLTVGTAQAGPGPIVFLTSTVNSNYFCAVTNSGGISCWGSNTNGQLGTGDHAQRTRPASANGITGASAVTTGFAHACVLNSNGGVRCWGPGGSFRLGNGDNATSFVPPQTATPTGLGSGISIIGAGFLHGCAGNNSTAYCWGYNFNGQIGNGTGGAGTDAPTPVALSGIGGVTSIAASVSFTCVATTSGAAMCWGDNGSGRLGDGTTTNRLAPVAVNGLSSGVTAVASGSDHACALKTGGTVWCWGANAKGQLGNGTTDPSSTPVQVNVSGPATSITAGSQFSCAVVAGGVECWGANSFNQLGNGAVYDNDPHPTPAAVSLSLVGEQVQSIASAQYSTCALTDHGRVWCWGGNISGEVGNGTDALVFAPTPVAVSLPSLTTDVVSAIAATTATANGNATSDGAQTITARGACWGASANPGLTDTCAASASAGVGAFTAAMTGLAGGTLYHVRAYITNAAGTFFGDDTSFSTPNVAPTVTTTAISNINAPGAAGGGIVTSDGGATVTARGNCWATTVNPTTSATCTSDGGGVGAYVSTLTGLSPGTTYHVRAYATNSVGTSYGGDVSFTAVTTPTLTTTAVTGVTATGATTGGTISSDGGAAVTARGSCLAVTANPTTSATCTTDGSGAGAYVSSLTGLSSGTTYHVRAYATNSVGTAYGADLVFTTATVPTLTTRTPSAISGTGATSGGDISTDGGVAVTSRGVCWALSANPTTASSCSSDGTGAGGFASAISGLSVSTTYHVRAYAANAVGTSYGNDVSFTTNATTAPPPVFSDDPVSASTTITAAHLTEMRQAVASLRVRYQLSAVTWTDSTIVVGTTVIKAIHLTELRTAVNELYVAAGRSPLPTYTNVAIVPGVTRISVLDVAELRRAILAIW